LPTLLPQLASRNTQPRAAVEYSPADADAWLKAAPELRSCLVDAVVRSAQEALERSGFSVGPVDGVLGPRTQSALREFQQQKGLPRSGLLDRDTLKALNAAERR
jgi:peptidoglycan hydrolase-like protein with peptidoglycan-binding domain